MSDFDAEKFMKPIKRRCEELHLGNGSVKRFDVSDLIPYESGVVDITGITGFTDVIARVSESCNRLTSSIKKHEQDRQRCKYCGCLVSNFDVHCSSCGAPI